jgi:hypothetical protein
MKLCPECNGTGAAPVRDAKGRPLLAETFPRTARRAGAQGSFLRSWRRKNEARGPGPSSVGQIDVTYGHLVPDSDEYVRSLMDAGDDRRCRGWNLNGH